MEAEHAANQKALSDAKEDAMLFDRASFRLSPCASFDSMLSFAPRPP